MNPQSRWICDGVPKDGKQYPHCAGSHSPHENSSPDCVICGLPKEAVVLPPQKKNGFKPVVVAVVTAFVGLVAVGAYYAIDSGLLISRSSRFYCALQPDPRRGGDVYTVMYAHDKGRKPWLKMLTTLGDGWTPNKRCEEIARRLEDFRKEGLTQMTYRSDIKTPKQYVICVKTKANGEECRLLLTLKPKADPYQTLNDMADALLGNGNVVEQKNPGAATVSSFSPSSPVIDLTNHLAAEDLQAGSNAVSK